MKRYPVGIQDFQKLREGGYLYIDKTKVIYKLLNSGSYFFLSRPRRFGKSLLMSTIKYFFQGEKELFQDLWISKNKANNWETYPVLHFSFSTLSYKDLGLKKALNQAVNLKAAEFQVTLEREGLGQRFQELIQKLGSGEKKVVLLIDEYDKPLIDYIDQQEQAEENRSTLKNFFSVIKDSDSFIHFLLITGVSKFSKVSIFSDLNHLLDITLDERFDTITGITQNELDKNFAEEWPGLSQKFGVSPAEVREEVKKWYNGYAWGEEKVYNPFSLLSFFTAKRFTNFWWESGTPTFLLKILRNEFQYNLEQVESGIDAFESYTLDNMGWRALLFQTGYLTIHQYEPDYRLYTLGYPNFEVKDSMLRHLLGVFREAGTGDSQMLFANLKRSLESHDMNRLIDTINTLFAKIPYQLFLSKKEAFFHAILHLSFSGLGMMAQAEVSTAQGRVDTVVHTKDRIYVMEFKLDEPAEVALAQIQEKGYASPYLGQGKDVIALGISFSSEKKAVGAWVEEEARNERS